jgi:large subunit ribosomal protein L2
MNPFLSKKKPEKKLLKFIKKKGGRNNTGKITIRHRGGGAKRLQRMIDFGQSQLGVPSRIVALEYDPNRTAWLALLESENASQTRSYVLAADGLKAGDKVICDDQAEIKAGNRLRLKNIPVGSQVFNIELQANRGGQLVRSAGASAKVLAIEGGLAHLELPSKEIRTVSQECFATLGTVSHSQHVFEKVASAGRRRRQGWRPTVRGSAMNPVDHPHGGGEGRTPIGLKYPKTPWGQPAKGVKTRKRHWTDRFIIQRRKRK